MKTADKTESRALIEHLVGYQRTNIFHIWLPTKEDIFVTRDVIFDTEQYYTGDEYYASESVIEEVIELLEYPSLENSDIELEELLTRRQCHNYDSVSAAQNTGSQIGGESSKSVRQSEYQPEPRNKDRELSLLGAFMPDEQGVPEGYRAYGEVAPRNINLDFDTSNIVTSKRRRVPRDPDVFAVNFQTAMLESTRVSEYLYAFSSEISRPLSGLEPPRIHQSQLPPLPKRVTDLDTHQYSQQFTEALQKEWRSLQAKGCFRKSSLTESTADAEVLPLM